jgi:WD40 repeat protein
MTGRKKWVLLAFCSLTPALLIVLFGRPRGAHLGAGEDRPSILEGHRSPILALAFDPDGATLTSAAGFQTNPREGVELIVWDLETGCPRVSHTGFQGDLSALVLSPDGTALATAAGDGSVRLWDSASLRERARLGDHRAAVCALAFSPDGGSLASADRANELMLWNATGKRLWACDSGDVRFLFALAFAPDGRTLAGGGTDTKVRLWDASSGKGRAALVGHANGVSSVAFAPDGRTLATGDRSGVVKLWDVTAGVERATLATARETGSAGKPIEEVGALAFAPDGRTIAVAVEETVSLWDVETGRRVTDLVGHEGKVRRLAYSSDGTLLASGGHDRTVRLWDVARRR